MRTPVIFCCWIACLAPAQDCLAQLTVNPYWSAREGLTVSSSQTITVPATQLRFFTTIKSEAPEPLNAITHLNKKKVAAVEALQKIGVLENAIHFSSTSVPEWEPNSQNQSFFNADSNAAVLTPSSDLQNYTAITHISFDVPLQAAEADKLLMVLYDTHQRLRLHDIFASSKITAIYVGQIKQSQITAATKRAYNEASRQAQSLAHHSNKALGKLAALTQEYSGNWRYHRQLGYGIGTSEKSNPLANFAPAENEAFGTDPAKLSRTLSLELRYNIE